MAILCDATFSSWTQHALRVSGFEGGRGVPTSQLRRMKNRPMYCELIPFHLKQAPHYDAISYTWGDPARNHGVFVNGRWLPLTASAYGIFQDRASFLTTKYLWIDLICINQADNGEKASQVQMMKDIFSMAVRVVIWLGDAPDADKAIGFVENFYTNILLDIHF
jgi:Heterokaryon incompatibility protein (HET)